MPVTTTTLRTTETRTFALQTDLEEATLYGHLAPRFDGPMDTRDVLAEDRLLLPNDQE